MWRARRGLLRNNAALAPAAGGGGGSTFTTIWNSADQAGGPTLTNGGLTASVADGNAGWIRADHGRTSGKYGWEITLATADQDQAPGFGATTSDMAGYGGAGQIHAFVKLASELNIEGTTVENGFPQGFAGDVWGWYLDIDAHRFYVRKNGTYLTNSATGLVGNPAAGTGGWAIPAGMQGVELRPYIKLWTYSTGVTETATANFGASAFAYALPTGYTGWNG